LLLKYQVGGASSEIQSFKDLTK